MHFISTRYHAIIDYLLGIYIFCIPMMCDYEATSAQALPLTFASLLMIANGLTSKLELGYIKAIPKKIHLLIDGAIGTLLAFSPWVFSFSQTCFLPSYCGWNYGISNSTLYKTTLGVPKARNFPGLCYCHHGAPSLLPYLYLDVRIPVT